jgi:peptide/nickel transport system substrate-binding protein
VIALQTGEIDVCINLPTMELGYVRDDSALKLIEVPDVVMLYLTMNNEIEPFKHQKVRQALAHAVNKQALLIAGLNGQGELHSNMINRGQFGLNKSITGYGYDLEKAKALLSEAGYPNGFTMELSFNGSARNLMAQVIQADFAKIGVTVDLDETESAALKGRLNEHKFQTALYAWTDADGTDFTVRSMYYTGSGSNRSLIANSEIDERIDEALFESDVKKRETMYNELDDKLTEICPIIPICTSVLNIGTRAKVEGIVWMSTAKHDYRKVYMEE